MKKPYTMAALGVIAVVIIVAIASFLNENWGVSGSPGMLERFIAKLALSSSRREDSGNKNPLTATEQNLAAGRDIYEKQCAFCHGLDGRGQNQQSGVQFYPPVPAIVGPTVELTDGQIQSAIMNGIRYTGMPSFSKVISMEESWKVVLWVRHIAQNPAAGQRSDASGSGAAATSGVSTPSSATPPKP